MLKPHTIQYLAILLLRLNSLTSSEILNIPYVLHWYLWNYQPNMDMDYPVYFPPKKGFKEAVETIQQMNVKVIPYINGRLFDIFIEKWLSDDAYQYCTKYRSAMRVLTKS